MHAPIADQSPNTTSGLTVVCAVLLVSTALLGLLTQSVQAIGIGLVLSLLILLVVGVHSRVTDDDAALEHV